MEALYMVDTLELTELGKFADNVYEAIVIIARRARQINEDQKQILERENEVFEEEDEEINEGIAKDIVDRKYIRLPKPTRIALEEFLAGKLTHQYLEEEEAPSEQ